MITGAFGYDQNTAEVISQREHAERQRGMYMREEAMRAALGSGVEVKQRQHGNVTREVQQLEKNLQALANVIDSLDIRLAAACIPAPENLASGLRSTDGGGCSLANQLAGFNSMLSHQITRIEMIYQGVDL
jgi:hypothetical protein